MGEERGVGGHGAGAVELLCLLDGFRLELHRLSGEVHAVGADLLYPVELWAAQAQLLPGGGRDGDPVELAGSDLQGSLARCVLLAPPLALQVGMPSWGSSEREAGSLVAEAPERPDAWRAEGRTVAHISQYNLNKMSMDRVCLSPHQKARAATEAASSRLESSMFAKRSLLPFGSLGTMYPGGGFRVHTRERWVLSPGRVYLAAPVVGVVPPWNTQFRSRAEQPPPLLGT